MSLYNTADMSDKTKLQFEISELTCQEREGRPGAFTAIMTRPGNLLHGFQMIEGDAFKAQIRERNLNLPVVVDHDYRVANMIGRLTNMRKAENGDIIGEGYFHHADRS